MKLHSIQIVDQSVLCLLSVIFVANVAFAIRTCFDNAATQKASITKRFGTFWKTRFVLHSSTALWMVAQALKIESMWLPAGRTLGPRFLQLAADGTLCRLFLTLSIGLLEPFCIFTGILLCRSILSKKGAAELHLPNWKILKAATLTTAPFTAVYSGFAWMSFMDPDLAWEESRRVGFYFLGTFRRGNIKDCGGNTARYGCVQCFTPAALGITSAFVYLSAMLLLFGGLLRRLNGGIDRKKTVRLVPLQICLTVSMFCLLVLRATSVIGGSPFAWVFQISWAWNNIAIACLDLMFMQFLITAPVWDMTADHD